jgi:hypothetical protein
MADDVTVYERDVWIVTYLASAPEDQRTIRDVWERAKQPRRVIGDDDVVGPGGLAERASLPTYHRTVAKLVARGFLTADDSHPDGVARYRVAPQVSSVTAISQADLNEALWEIGPTQALAYYVDVVEKFEASAESVLRRAAEGLMQEEPRALILRLLQDRAREIDEDIADLRDPETAEDGHRRRLSRKLTEFSRFVHGELGLNPAVWRVPAIEEVEETSRTWVTPDGAHWEPVREELSLHVFGERFIEFVDIAHADQLAADLVVAGSDGSSHVGQVRGMPAAAYSDDERLLLTFNNSAGYVDIPQSYPERYPTPFHGVPATRATLEDPSHRGMIISRPWFEDLNDGEFEHMKKAALDVVQFRIDESLLSGSALPFGSHPMIHSPAFPKPNLLVRDGAVAPQARELQNYANTTAYGEIVREGIRLSYRILGHVRDSDKRVFAGAVKSTQLRTFSRIVSWYIQRGSARHGQPAIDCNWQLERMGVISDSVAMTRLLNTLPALKKRTQFYRTAVVVRPFTAMVTQLNRVTSVPKPSDWPAHFEKMIVDQRHRFEKHGGERPYFLGRDVSEDEYVRMCMYADYAMFYFGRPGASPQLTFPRFEFLDAIRARPESERAARVHRAVEIILAGIHRTKWSLDREHNMMTNRKLPKLVPFVVYQAHETCKVLGHKLASELQQAIAASLSSIKAMRGLAVPKIDIEPVSLQKFQKYLRKLKGGAAARGEAIGDGASAEEGPADLLHPSSEGGLDVPSDGLGE